jgi:tubulin--tyrosine ligase-like protein 12
MDISTQQQEDEAFKKFMEFHELQLYGIRFPKTLERKLFDKLRQEVFDIGFKVKIMVDQEEDRVDLQCAAATLKKDEDVFLVDHLWTFKQRDVLKVLKTNDKLLERMLNIVKHSEKLDLPSNPYEKARPTLQEYLASLTPETREYDFDEYGIASLAHLPFSPLTEQVSLFNNNIENPGEITSYLLDLPNLKALWLNGNPVVDNCVNFNQIAELMPALEIINSKLTARAGAWAMLFYAKDQQVSRIEDIRVLDLTSKGLLYVKDISIFSQMSSLETLNLSDHPEFLQTDEQLQEEESKLKEGSPD